MRLFLDANVIFSASYRETGSTRVFFRLAHGGVCELFVSHYAMEEAIRNLMSKHPQRMEDLRLLRDFITMVSEAPQDLIAWSREKGLPDKDAPILAAAIHARVDILVTGDRRDFGALYGRTFLGVEVLRPSAALERVLAQTD